MANRFTRQVGALDPFRPKGAVAEGLDQIDRSGRLADDEALFSVGNSLSSLFGSIADDQAKIEGDRAGKIAGNDPNYRPSGATTIRGQAMDKAGTAGYLDNLDAKMRQQMTEAYQLHKDNPQGLKAAFDEVKAGLMNNDVFKEIQAPVNASFERLRLPFESRASDALLEKTRDEARAARINREVTSGGYRAATLEANPADPKAQEIVRDELRKEDAADRQLVDNGAMTATQAATRSIERKRDAAQRQAISIVNQAETIDQIDKMRERFEINRKEGKDPIFKDAVTMDAVDLAIEKRRAKILTEGKRINVLTEKTSEDMLSRAERGTPPPPGEIQALREAAKTPEQQAIVSRHERRMQAIELLNSKGPQALDVIARTARSAAPNPTKAQAEDIQYLEELATRRRQQVEQDPVKAVRQSGVAPVDMLRLDDPAQLADGVRKRVALASATAGDINPRGRMLEQDEINGLKFTINQGGEKAVQTVKALADGAGRDAPRLFREIGGNAPELAQAGLLMTAGRNQAAREVLAGVALRNVEGGAKAREVHEDTFNKAWVSTVGPALIDNPQDQSRIKQTAKTIAMYKLRNAEDMRNSNAQDVYRQSIQEAMGQQKNNGATFGGVAKVRPGWWTDYPVVAPPDVRADRFKDAIDSVRDEDLAKQSVPPVPGTTARQLRQAVPVAVPGGYRFATGDPQTDPKWIKGADGSAFVLRWDDIKGELRNRVPRAFEGGE